MPSSREISEKLVSVTRSGTSCKSCKTGKSRKSSRHINSRCCWLERIHSPFQVWGGSNQLHHDRTAFEEKVVEMRVKGLLFVSIFHASASFLSRTLFAVAGIFAKFKHEMTLNHGWLSRAWFAESRLFSSILSLQREAEVAKLGQCFSLVCTGWLWARCRSVRPIQGLREWLPYRKPKNTAD